MMDSLKRRFRRLLGIPRTVWEDKRGSVKHRYTFDDDTGDYRSRYISYSVSSYSVIEYNLPNFSGCGDDGLDIYLNLVHDTLHELTHWACNDSDYSRGYDPNGKEHSERWAAVLIDELDYVHEEFEIKYQNND